MPTTCSTARRSGASEPATTPLARWMSAGNFAATGGITPSSNAEPILIGDSPTYGGIDGRLDELAVSATTVSATEVQQRYELGSAG